METMHHNVDHHRIEGFMLGTMIGDAIGPVTPALVRRLAASVGQGGPRGFSLRWLAQVPRNQIFLITVLIHGARRLLPPYGSAPPQPVQ